MKQRKRKTTGYQTSLYIPLCTLSSPLQEWWQTLQLLQHWKGKTIHTSSQPKRILREQHKWLGIPPDQSSTNTEMLNLKKWIGSVQSLSPDWLFVNPWTAAHQVSLLITNSQSWLKLMSIQSVMPCNHLILCCPLLLLPSIFPSIRIFYNESVLCIRWPDYWSFCFSFSPSNEYSGLISFRIDWFDLFAGQGILKSLLQHHSSKASILWCHSALFMVQLSLLD